ncbi:alpha/beta fold hydrolase [Phenylobacterium immobile]|uniref:alpha/beta fold hydrolase n=1 Tax=Phenylobacterium immobile TaxID=21 RepID=UPI000A6A404E|nr:alpha/beta fold hydrolase [Phenylobacterium immobile]
MSLDPHIADRYVEVAGRKIRYIEKGEGRALVCLHGVGFSLSADMWLPHLDAFAAISRVICLDIPGWGLSDPLPEPTFQAWADTLKGFADALGITEMDVFGYSVGGWIACLTARDHPGLVRRLVLLDAPGMNIEAPNFIANFKPPSREHLKEDMEMHAGDAACLYATDAQVDAMMARLSRPGAEDAYRAAAGEVANPESRRANALHSVFPVLTMPILIAQMDNAGAVLIRYMFEAYQLAPNGRMLIYFGGTRRFVHGVRPVAEATAIEFFTAESVPPAPRK